MLRDQFNENQKQGRQKNYSSLRNNLFDDVCLQKQNHQQLLTYTFITDASHIFLVETHLAPSRFFCDILYIPLVSDCVYL